MALRGSVSMATRWAGRWHEEGDVRAVARWTSRATGAVARGTGAVGQQGEDSWVTSREMAR